MAIIERINQEDLIVYEIFKNPVLFGEFMMNVDNLEGDEEFELTIYQKEFMLDFGNYVSLTCARTVGKTVAISLLILWALIFNIFPNDYLIYTVPNKVHLEPVFTNLSRLLRSNSILKNFIDPKGGINNSDFSLKLLNNTKLMCRIAGQSGTGANVIGLHSPYVLLDEAGYYPVATFNELQPVMNTWERGFKLLTSGVPTGVRENNVLYHCDRENNNYSKHRVSAFQNPRFLGKDKQRAIEQYGGEDSDEYIHSVLGQHGKPIFSLFDRSTFQIQPYPIYKITVDGIRESDNLADMMAKIAMIPPIANDRLDRIFGIDLGYCYSSDTEVLTKRGWLKHQEMTTDDIVACFDTRTSKIKWDHPLYIWEQDYIGEMLEITGKSTNFMVSPEHSVWVRKLKEDIPQTYEKLKAKDLLLLKNNRFRVRISPDRESIQGPNMFEVPYYYCDRKDREIVNTNVSMTDWVQFLGWFISEGSTTPDHGWEVSITQALGKYSEKIDLVLSRLPYTVNRRVYTTQWGKEQVVWRITCKELCEWLRDNCGIGSKLKKIPEFIFDCSTDDKEIFLKTLLMGDGSRVNCNRSPQYNSQSELLIDQVQRLALMLGYSSTKGQYKDMYRTTIMKRIENELYRDSSIKKVDYNGKIYCLKTKTGFYITRRKGKIVIAGNTEPTAIFIMFIDDLGRMKFHAKIQLSKVSYPTQEKIIDILDSRFNPSIIGMDKGSAGIAVIQDLLELKDYAHKDYKKKIVPIDFSASMVLGLNTEGEEIKSKTKPFTVSVLQDYTNNGRIIYTSTDMEMIVELERMTYTKTVSGEIAYRTLAVRGGKKGDDHFTSALLCAATSYYLMNEFSFARRARKKLFRPSWI